MPFVDRNRDERTEQQQFLGKPIDRIDGRAKVTGTAKFAAEHSVEGLVHAALVFSAVSNGTIRTIDTSAAEQAPGVLKVITHHNAAKMKTSPLLATGEDPTAGTTTVKILNTDKLSWNGQPVAVVVADTLDRAEYAASLVKVTHAAEPGANSFEASIPSAQEPKHILGEAPAVAKGHPDAALQSADYKIDLKFTTPPYNHNAIEPHACIAVWDEDDKLTLYDATQFTAGTA